MNPEQDPTLEQPAPQPQPAQPMPQPQPVQQPQPAQPTQPMQPASAPVKKSSAKKIIIIVIIVIVSLGLIGATLRAFVMLNPDLADALLPSDTFNGDRFSLKYNSLWEKQKYARTDGDSGDGLSYDNGRGSLLMNMTSTLRGESVATEFGRESLLNSLYTAYERQGEYEIYQKHDFQILKDDIYCARLDYKINGRKRGSFFFLASDSKDALISFMTNTSQIDIDEFADLALRVLKTIEID